MQNETGSVFDMIDAHLRECAHETDCDGNYEFSLEVERPRIDTWRARFFLSEDNGEPVEVMDIMFSPSEFSDLLLLVDHHNDMATFDSFTV